jgi:hypothetical protein
MSLLFWINLVILGVIIAAAIYIFQIGNGTRSIKCSGVENFYANEIVLITDLAIGLTTSDGEKYGDVDDAFAIVLAACQNAPIAAIVVQFGNVSDVDAMFDKLKMLIKKLGYRTKLIKGPDSPYEPGSFNMRELKKVIKSPVDIWCISPATTVAYMLNDPYFKIGKVYLEMGQTATNDDCGFTLCDVNVGDFNFKTDVASVENILANYADKCIFVTFEDVKKLTFDRNALLKLSSGTSLEQWIAENSQNWFDQWTSIFKCENFIHLWDSVLIMVALGTPCTYRRATAEVEACVSETSIMTTRLAITETPTGQSIVVKNCLEL